MSGARDKSAEKGGGGLHPWLLAVLTALFVARPLIPSDAGPGDGAGVLFVMLWILLSVFWLLSGLRRPGMSLRFGWVDAAMGLLVVWHSLAALVAMGHGSPRPANNMLWEWIALGLSYFLVRQLVATAQQMRAMLAVMVSLAVGLSAMGFYQYFVTMPDDRAQYEAIKDDPAAMIQATGTWNPPGSADRKRFEDRLNSTEPTTTFVLANSLAGYLAPWLVVMLGIGVVCLRDDPMHPIRWLVYAWLALAVAMGLALTKSRSAMLAAAAGVALLWPACAAGRSRAAIGWLLVISLAVAVLVVGLGWSGLLDVQVLTEAGKSLGYRWQYWQATAAMIRAQPLLGCGPGQFQDAYTAHKLADASEEIQDPHNFLLEVWATAGTPAAILLLVVLGLYASRMLRPAASRKSPPEATSDESFPVWTGAFGGLLLAFFLSPAAGFPLAALDLCFAIGGMLAVLLLLRTWVADGDLPPLLTTVGATVLLINLLAAGGISYAGVAGSLWLLLGLGLNQSELGERGRRMPIALAAVGAAGGVLLAVACYLTAYQPVLTSRGALGQAQGVAALRDFAQRDRLLVEAAAADPASAEIALRLAAHRFEWWRSTSNRATLDAFQDADKRARELAPRSGSTWGELGVRHRLIHQTLGGDSDHLQTAVEALRRAVELYPTSAALRTELAITLELSGRDEEASSEAAEALRLNEIVFHAGHTDKLLPEELEQEARRINDSRN